MTERSNQLRLLRLPEVQSMVGLRRSEIYRRISAGTFPAPIRLGPNCVAWTLADCEAWIAARVAESRGAAE